jgi:uncharacterized protein (DUF433 family)
MTSLAKARLTVPEAAFVVGIPAKTINREIDVKIITASGAERKLRGFDLLYLAAIKDVRNQIGPALRKSFRRAISDAAAAGRPEVKCHHFVFDLDDLRKELVAGFEQLERTMEQHIEERGDVLGGEPVLKGTRIAVRHVADLVRQGATFEEIREDYDLASEQIEAALVYDRTRPKRGRPLARRSRTSQVSAAR